MTSTEAVIDASVFVDGIGLALPGAAEALASVDGFLVPPHFGLEVLNAARRLERRGLMDAIEVDNLVDSALDESVVRVDVGDDLSLITAMRHNISPFDAVYVLLATTFDVPLMTADRRLARAAEGRCEVRLV